MVGVSFGSVYSRPKEVTGDIISGKTPDTLRVNLLGISYIDRNVVDEEVMATTIPSDLNSFSFRIPVKFTPSFEGISFREDSVSVKYALSIMDDILETELCRTSITIEADMNRSRRSISVKEVVPISSGVFCCCNPDRNQKIVFLVDGDSDICVAGDSITLHIEIYNYSTLKVDSLKVKLRHLLNISGKKSNEDLNTIEFKGIEPGRYMPSFPVTFTFPRSSIPTTKFRTLFSTYHVEIICVTSGVGNAIIKVPVTLIPPRKPLRNMHETT